MAVIKAVSPEQQASCPREGGLGYNSAGVHEDARDEQSEDEAADVCEERDAAAVCLRGEEAEVRLDELVDEPEAEEDVRGDPDRPEDDERQDARFGIEHEVRAEDGC